MCRPVIPLNGLRHGLWTGWHAGVPTRRSGGGVVLASDDRAEQAHARHACDIAQHVMPGKRPLIQGRWPVLTLLGDPPEAMVAMAQETSELTQRLGRTQRRGTHALTRELWPPATITAIGLRASRDMLDVAGVDQGHRKATRLTPVQQRHPGDACRCHHHCGAPTGRQAVGKTRQSPEKGPQWLERVDIAVCRHTTPRRFSAPIDACGMGMHAGHVLGGRLGLLPFVGQRCLP
jgi:hypothetical protein